MSDADNAKRNKLISNVLTGLLVVVIGLNVWWYLTRQEEEHALTDQPAPTFHLPTLDVEAGQRGDPLALEDFRGKVVLLDFWATYCPPCRKQMPIIERLYQDLSGEKFAVISINTDSAGKLQKVVSYVRDGGYTFPVVLGDGQTLGRYQVTRIPTLVLVDPQGIIRLFHVGMSSEADLRQNIQALFDSETS